MRRATFAEVRSACRRWHYTRRVATANLDAFAVLERDPCDPAAEFEFAGVVTFGSGASPSIGRPFGLGQPACRELTRVALRPGHRTPVSRVLRVACMLFRRDPRGRRLRLCVSYADSGRGHHGGVYQAAGWYYLGPVRSHAYRVRGRLIHPRTCGQRFGTQAVEQLRARVDPRACRVNLPPKHKYVYLWDRRLAPRLAGQLRPYPKRPGQVPPIPRAGSIAADAPPTQGGEGGSIPTPALTLPLHPGPHPVPGLPRRHPRRLRLSAAAPAPARRAVPPPRRS